MKKIICELCESTEFTKEGGMFTCQGCGTKYSLEEAKAMMKEVEGDAPSTAANTSAPAAGAPAPAANSQQIENLLILATNAFEASNNPETEGYCNKVIELDVTCYKAWLLKGQAVGWESTYGKPRVEEGANAMRKAVEFAPEEEKDQVAREALRAIKNICNALASLAKSNFSKNPTEDNRFKFGEFLRACSAATDLFNDVSDEIRDYGLQVWKEHKRFAAEQMNYAGVAAINFVREKWEDIDHPNKSSWDTYLDWFGEIRLMFEDSIKWGQSVDEKDSEIIIRYKNRIVALEDPMDSKCYKREWNSWSSSYEWVTDYYLSDSAKTSRRNMVQESRDAIKKIEDKAKEREAAAKRAAEEAKQQRIKLYWEEHKEEKDKLDAEKNELSGKKSALEAEIAELNKQINAMQPVGTVPSENEAGAVMAQINTLEARKAGLSLFAGKEKKQIAEEIAALQARMGFLQGKIEEEKRARAAAVDAQTAPYRAKRDELSNQCASIDKRMAAIEAELKKDPEER